MEEVTVGEVELRIALNELAFELELNDGDGLLHARHLLGVTEAVAFAHETRGGVAAIDGAGEALERRERNAVAFFELREAPVAEGNSDDRCDAGVAAEAGAKPRSIVISP